MNDWEELEVKGDHGHRLTKFQCFLMTDDIEMPGLIDEMHVSIKERPNRTLVEEGFPINLESSLHQGCLPQQEVTVLTINMNTRYAKTLLARSRA